MKFPIKNRTTLNILQSQKLISSSCAYPHLSRPKLSRHRQQCLLTIYFVVDIFGQTTIASYKMLWRHKVCSFSGLYGNYWINTKSDFNSDMKWYKKQGDGKDSRNTRCVTRHAAPHSLNFQMWIQSIENCKQKHSHNDDASKAQASNIPVRHHKLFSLHVRHLHRGCLINKTPSLPPDGRFFFAKCTRVEAKASREITA